MIDQQQEDTRIQLLKCTRQKCSHVFTSEEFKKVPWPGQSCGKLMVCPQCENDSTYTLGSDGIAADPETRINAHDIEPSNRLGLKMRRRVFAAKRRAIK